MVLPAAVVAVATPGGGDEPRLTVTALLQRMHDLDGREVAVRGWLSGCHGGFACTLRPRPDRRSQPAKSLTIGFDATVEPLLGAMDGREVVVRGRVTDACRSGRDICLVRSPDLLPLSVVAR